MQEVPPSLGDHDKGSPDLQPLTALLGDKSTAKAQLNRQQPLGGVGPSQGPLVGDRLGQGPSQGPLGRGGWGETAAGVVGHLYRVGQPQGPLGWVWGRRRGAVGEGGWGPRAVVVADKSKRQSMQKQRRIVRLCQRQQQKQKSFTTRLPKQHRPARGRR